MAEWLVSVVSGIISGPEIDKTDSEGSGMKWRKQQKGRGTEAYQF